MAEKGDRAKLEGIAMRLYVDGQSLKAIEAALGVSRQSLSEWKARTKRPGEEFDDWDRAREQKRSNVQRVNDIFADQLTYVEETSAANRDSKMIDALAKLGALVERSEKIAAAARKQALEEAATAIDQAAAQAGPNRKDIPPETLAYIKEVLYGLR